MTVGMPLEAKQIVMKVAASQTIKRGDAVYLSGDMQVSICDESNREVFGIAAHDYPIVSGSSSNIAYGSDAKDQGPSQYDSVRDVLTVDLEGTVWLNVQIPTSGSNITLSVGDRVVNSLVAAVDGTVDLYPETPAMNDETASKLALANSERIIGKCIAALHLGLKSNDKLLNEDASLGTNVPVSDELVADGSANVYAKVPVKLNLR